MPEKGGDMTKFNWFPTFIAVLLAVLILPIAGCITIVRQPAEQPPPPPPPPVINSFTISPETISAGQRTTLSWKVTGATAVTIEPEIGEVGAGGSLLLSPAATITYNLTASNESGSTTGSVTVTVMVSTDKPDLVITDIWLTGAVVNYKIKNQGNAAAKPTWTYFYVNNLKKAEGYVDILAAGEEKTESFSNLDWRFPGAGGDPSTTMARFDVRACADGGSNIEESSKDNNCLTKIWGHTFTYDFVKNAHLAKWRSSAGDLKWPMVSYDNKGAAYLLYDTVVMCPEPVSNGWIQGRFADFYIKYYGQETTSRELVVPENARFTARVGFEPGKVSTDGVRVALGYLDATGSVVLLPKMDVYSDGTMRPYEVDLSSLAGKKTEFILWVEAKDSPQGDCVRWAESKIVQE